MALRKEEFHYDPHHPNSGQEISKKRVTIDISDALYNQVKVEAYQHNQSVSEYIGNVLNQSLPAEACIFQQTKPLSSEIVTKILETHQQILQDTHGHQFEDSTELIRQMRLERAEELDQR